MAVKTDKFGNPKYMDKFYDRTTAEGVPDHNTIFRYSRDDNVTQTPKTVWSENFNYIFPTTGEQWFIASDDVNDNATGTGLRKVVLFYHDSNREPGFEILTLNGTTPVGTVSTDIFRFVALTPNPGFIVGEVGSTGSNEGKIYIGTGTFTAGKPENIYGTIVPGKNVSQVGVDSTPANRQWAIHMNFWGVEAAKDCIFTFDLDLGGNGIFFNGGDFIVTAGSTIVNWPYVIQILPGSDVRYTARSEQATSALAFAILFHEMPFPLTD